MSDNSTDNTKTATSRQGALVIEEQTAEPHQCPVVDRRRESSSSPSAGSREDNTNTTNNTRTEARPLHVLSRELDDQDRLAKMKALSLVSTTTTTTTSSSSSASSSSGTVAVLNPETPAASIHPPIQEVEEEEENSLCRHTPRSSTITTLHSPLHVQPGPPPVNNVQTPLAHMQQEQIIITSPVQQQQQLEHQHVSQISPDLVLEADVALVTTAETVTSGGGRRGGDSQRPSAAAAALQDGSNVTSTSGGSGGGGGGGGSSSRRRKVVGQARQARLSDFLENTTLQLTLGVLLCCVVISAVVVGVTVTLNNSGDTASIETTTATATTNADGTISNSYSGPVFVPTASPVTMSPTISPRPSVAPTNRTTDAPSSAPTFTPLLIDGLEDYTIEAFENEQSPQALAYEWIRNHPNLDQIPNWRRQQQLALAAIYYSIHGDDVWSDAQRANYLNYSVHECEWGLNECNNNDDSSNNNADAIITGLNLQCHLVTASASGGSSLRLAPEIALLTSLQTFRVNYCKNKRIVMSAFLPQQLATLNASLRTLDLYNNNVAGSVDPAGPIPKLQQLTYLSLDSNVIGGSLPTELGQLTKLTFLSVAWNRFVGSIPRELGQLTKLTTFRMYTNRLEGFVPTEISLLTALESLELQNNNLVGWENSTDLCTRIITSLDLVSLDCEEIECPVGCECRCGP